MTKKEINKAIALKLGVTGEPPNYCSDRSEMYLAEKLSGVYDQKNPICHAYFVETLRERSWGEDAPLSLTPFQRAKAFVRAFGLWKE